VVEVAVQDVLVAPPPRGPVDPATALLVTGVEAVLASPSVDLPAPLALERLRVMLVLGVRLTAAQAESVQDLARRELFALDGAGSAAGWLRAQQVGVLAGASPAAGQRWQGLARVAEAVRGGILAPRSAEAVARAVDAVPDDEAGLQEGALAAMVADGVPMVLAAARGGEPAGDPAWGRLRSRLRELATSSAPVRERLEEVFLLMAQELPPGSLAPALEQLVDAVRPEEAADREADAHERRHASLVRAPGSGWRLTADLDDEAGELCSKLFSAFDRVERDSGISLQGMVRSRGQRRHDALSAAMRCALESGEVPADGGVRPHITVTVDVEQLDGLAGSLPARTDGGICVARDTLQRWLCDARVQLALTDGRGHVLDVGRALRTATPKQRTALRVAWSGCAVLGCGRGWRHLTPHHVVPWSLGGTSDLSNLVPLCDGCHHDVHEGSRVLRLTDYRLIGPEGWVDPPPT
jgi:hypothetical protein